MQYIIYIIHRELNDYRLHIYCFISTNEIFSKLSRDTVHYTKVRVHLCFLHPIVVRMSIDSLKSINLTVIEKTRCINTSPC